MEKLNFVRNGVIRLPPGFRFHPTDEELVVQYLRRKVFAFPLPASIIPEVDICKYDPWDLPGDSEQERYFFSTREAKYRNGSRPNRATGSGYWKATGIDKRIAMSKSNQVVGMKKTLVFYRGKPPHGCRTDWIMHEYRLAEAGAILPQQRKNSAQASMEDWVLCRIFLKKRNTRSEEDVVMQQPCKKNQVANLTLPRPRFIDFMMQDKIVSNQYTSTSSSSSSSSGSSGITEVSSSVSDQEENGSSSSNVSSFSCRDQE